MKPISLPLPFFGLTIRIEAAPAPPRRIPAVPHHPVAVLKPPPGEAFGRRLLQDIGLDRSRTD